MMSVMSDATRTGPYRIFISRVSREFDALSIALASDLRKKGLAGKIQIDFRQEADTETTLDLLEKHVRESDAVIALVGEQSGSFPSESAAAKWRSLIPDGADPTPSYSQWEIHFARAYRKRLSFYFSSGYAPEKSPAPKNVPASQEAWRHWLTQDLAINRDSFSTENHLCRLVLGESWPEFPRIQPRNLPFDPLGDLFIGRDNFVAYLRDEFKDALANSQRPPRHIIWGLGGVGKTRLAIEYAWKHAEDYSALLFLSGRDATQLEQNIANLTGVLGLAETAGKTTPENFRAALEWLRANPGWLMIIDNVDDTAAVDHVQQLLPEFGEGHVIVTARLGAWKPGVKPLELSVLSAKAASQYLLAATDGARMSTSGTTDEDVHAPALAADLAHLALALETAAAYIRQRHLSFEDYRALLAEQPLTALDFLDPNATHYEKSVARTWLISFDRLTEPARQLLAELAWFAPDPIPRFLLDHDPDTGEECDPGPALDQLRELEQWAFIHWDPGYGAFHLHRLVQQVSREAANLFAAPQPCHPEPAERPRGAADDPGTVRTSPSSSHAFPVADAPGAQEAQSHAGGPSASLGMTEHGEPGKLSSSHPTPPEAAESPETSPYPSSLLAALRWLNAAMPQAPEDVRTWPVVEPLAPHALSAVSAMEANVAEFARISTDDPEAASNPRNSGEFRYERDSGAALTRLLACLGVFRYTRAQYAAAESLYRRTLAITEASFGPDHPKVATDLNNLALLLKDTNRLSEAKEPMRRALEIFTASLGPDHPNTLTVAGNLQRLLDEM
ncbi:MAG: hypothetical protein ACI8UO_003308 [Verrucomicrobiales bacterium]|jgi:hypothetical protein